MSTVPQPPQHTAPDDPAFPVVLPPESDVDGAGMTFREWLAGQAMVGIIAAHAGEGVALPRGEVVAQHAVGYADALLAELAKGG